MILPPFFGRQGFPKLSQILSQTLLVGPARTSSPQQEGVFAMSSVALESPRGLWARLPVWLRAIVSGLLIGLVAANVWPVFLIKLGMPLAALVEAAFLATY